MLFLGVFALPVFAEVENFIESCKNDTKISEMIKRSQYSALENEECPNIPSFYLCLNQLGPPITDMDEGRKFSENLKVYANKNLAACEISCENGNAKSCAMAGTTRIQGIARKYEYLGFMDHMIADLEEKHHGLLLSMKACEGGVAFGCQLAVDAGKNFWSPSMINRVNRFVIEKVEEEDWYISSPIHYAEMGCKLEDAVSCKMGYQILRDFPYEENHGDYDIEIFKNGACEFGSKLDCRAVSRELK